MTEEKAEWYHYVGAGVFLLMVGAMAVYGFGEMWLGWDQCPGPGPFGRGQVNGTPSCTGDESIMPIFGGIFAPMLLLLAVVGLVIFAVTLKAKCGHLSLSSLYERGPKAEGSKFILAAKKCRACGALFPCNMTCQHPKARNAYDQRPPSEGRKLKAIGKTCPDCGAFLPLVKQEAPE